MTRYSDSKEVLVTVTGTKLRESDKAVLFKIHQVSEEILDESRTMWIPLSQVRKLTTNKNLDESDTLVITEWIAKTKELI